MQQTELSHELLDEVFIFSCSYLDVGIDERSLTHYLGALIFFAISALKRASDLENATCSQTAIGVDNALC